MSEVEVLDLTQDSSDETSENCNKQQDAELDLSAPECTRNEKISNSSNSHESSNKINSVAYEKNSNGPEVIEILDTSVLDESYDDDIEIDTTQKKQSEISLNYDVEPTPKRKNKNFATSLSSHEDDEEDGDDDDDLSESNIFSTKIDLNLATNDEFKTTHDLQELKSDDDCIIILDDDQDENEGSRKTSLATPKSGANENSEPVYSQNDVTRAEEDDNSSNISDNSYNSNLFKNPDKKFENPYYTLPDISNEKDNDIGTPAAISSVSKSSAKKNIISAKRNLKGRESDDDGSIISINSYNSDVFKTSYEILDEPGTKLQESYKTPEIKSKASLKQSPSTSSLDEDDLLYRSPIFKKKSSAPSTTTSISTNNLSLSRSSTISSLNSTSIVQLKTSETLVATSATLSQKEQKMLEREKAKQNKEAKKQRKRLEREEKKRQKEQAAADKVKRTKLEQQAKGNFAEKEICLLLSNSFKDSDLGNFISSCFIMDEYVVAVIPQERSQYFQFRNNMLSWMRCDFLSGGAKHVLKDIEKPGEVSSETQMMNAVIILFHKDHLFLPLIEKDGTDQEYGKLDDYVQSIRSSLPSQLIKHYSDDKYTKIVFILHDVKTELSNVWKKGGKKRKSFSGVTEDDLHDSIVYLLAEHKVDVEITSSQQELADMLLSMTKNQAFAPYYESKTELHCVKKLKKITEQSIFCKQLQQLPGVSPGMSLHFITHYPTWHGLMQQYKDENLTEEQKKTLVMNCFHSTKKSVKSSDSLFRMMNNSNSLELL